METYRVFWGENSWDVKATSEEDAIDEFMAGIVQQYDDVDRDEVSAQMLDADDIDDECPEGGLCCFPGGASDCGGIPEGSSGCPYLAPRYHW